MPLRSGIAGARSRGANNNIYIETITFNNHHLVRTTMDNSHASVLLPHISWGRSLQKKTLTPTLTQTSRPMSSRHYTSWSSDDGEQQTNACLIHKKHLGLKQTPRRCPQSAQETPGKHRGDTRATPSGRQEAPKRCPGGPQSAPEAPRSFPEAPRRHPGDAQSATEPPRSFPKAPEGRPGNAK